MEEDQEQRFICKFCNKSLFSGQSLGGHMRVHLGLISAKKLEDQTDGDMGFEGEDDTNNGFRSNPKKIWTVSHSSNGKLNFKQEKLKNSNVVSEGVCYGLRENPKKSWRVSNPKHGGASRKYNVCRECGKGFGSSRALSVHMRCHSIREKEGNLCEKCGKQFDSMKALFGHMRSHPKRAKASNESEESQSDYETPYRKKSRIRYKSAVNYSLSDSENEEELEEIALCLLMLSRGVKNWGEVNSVTETSENDSPVLEAQALSGSKGIAEKVGGLLVGDGDKTWKVKKPREKLHSSVSVSGNSMFDKNGPEFSGFRSGFANDDEKTVELGVSVDGFLRGDEFKKPNENDQSGIDLCDHENEKGIESTEVELDKAESKLMKPNMSKNKRFDEEIAELGVSVEGFLRGDDLKKPNENDQSGIEVELDKAESKLMKPNMSKNERFDDHDREFGENHCDKTTISASEDDISVDSEKKSEYNCRTCNKVFRSHRALGGHQISHKTMNSRPLLKMKRCEKSLQTSLFSDTSALSKLEKVECSKGSLDEGLGVAVAVTRSKVLDKSKEHECPVCFKVFASGQALGGHKRAHYAGFSENGAKEALLVGQELPVIHNTFGLNLPVFMKERPVTMLGSIYGGLEASMSMGH